MSQPASRGPAAQSLRFKISHSTYSPSFLSREELNRAERRDGAGSDPFIASPLYSRRNSPPAASSKKGAFLPRANAGSGTGARFFPYQQRFKLTCAQAH